MTTAVESQAASISAASLPTLRVARFEDYPYIERLESSHGLLTLNERDWRAIYEEHPLYARLGSDWPIGWVLEDAGGSIVGSMANIPSQCTFRGRELIAATGRAWVVAEQYRGYSLWVMEEYFNQPNVDLFMNTTVNSLAVDPFTAFGSKRVPMGDWDHAAYWITNYGGFAQTALTVKHAPMRGLLKFPLAAALRVKDALSVRYPVSAGQPFNIEQTDHFNARFDSFWEELKRQKPDVLLNVRDRRTLSWHFAGPMRSKTLWIFTASRGGQMSGYAVFKRQDHPPSGLVRMRLVDFQSIDAADPLPDLLNAALQRCKAEKIHTLEHVGCDLPKMRALDSVAPYRRQLPAWPYYYQAVDPALDAELKDAARWDASSFDGDASL